MQDHEKKKAETANKRFEVIKTYTKAEWMQFRKYCIRFMGWNSTVALSKVQKYGACLLLADPQHNLPKDGKAYEFLIEIKDKQKRESQERYDNYLKSLPV